MSSMEIEEDGQTLFLRGDFDVRSTMKVRDAIYAHVYGTQRDLVIDLTEVPSIDLTAARVLAFAALDAGRAGHHLRLRGCRPAVRRMLRLSRLGRFVELEHVADAG